MILTRFDPFDRRFLLALWALAVLALLWPIAALADVPGAAVAAPSLVDGFLAALFTPGGLATVAGTLVSILALIGVNTEVRRRRVALAVYHAFHVVEDIDNERNDATLDKAVAGLAAVDRYMVANGWRPLHPGEQLVAEMGFKALNGVAAAQEKLQRAVSSNDALAVAMMNAPREPDTKSPPAP